METTAIKIPIRISKCLYDIIKVFAEVNNQEIEGFLNVLDIEKALNQADEIIIKEIEKARGE